MDNRQLEMEKLFSENIDRLLAGEQIAAGPETGEDVSAALEFAQKMITVTPEPSARFEAQLQAKLLTRLAQQETSEKAWFWKLVPRQPVWQAVAASIFVAIVGLIMWMSGVFTPATVPSALTANAATDKAVYAQGEIVHVGVTLTNTAAEPLTIKQFPPIVSIMDSGTRQPVFTYHAGTTGKTLMPGETIEFSVSWQQNDTAGNYVTGGSYYIELEDLDSQGQPMRLGLSDPVEFEILPAGSSYGDIYKTISLNQSQTANDITVTLKELHLTDAGAFLTAAISPPPDYNKGKNQDYAAFATYYLDNGWIKYAGLSTVEYNTDGMEHVWYFTEPVPPDTGELLIIITNIGEWEGPWEFHILLGQ